MDFKSFFEQRMTGPIGRLDATVFAFLLGALGAGQAGAQEWEYTVAPYLWAPGLTGDVSPGPRAPTVGLDASFSDLLDELDIGFLLAGTAKRGNLGLFGDIQYFDFNSGDVTPGPLFGDAVLDSDITVLTFGADYAVLSTAESELRLAAGVRYYDVSMDLDLSAGLRPAASFSGGDDWWDGLVGLRGHTNINQNWYASGWALLGAGGSDFASDVFAGFGYRVSATTDIVGGYRYFSVDREDGNGFVYDVEQHGLLLGVKFNF